MRAASLIGSLVVVTAAPLTFLGGGSESAATSGLADDPLEIIDAPHGFIDPPATETSHVPLPVSGFQKINNYEGNFQGHLGPIDNFGSAVSGIGDLDGDGIPDIAVGARLDDDAALDAGAAYILFMNANGTVRADHKITYGDLPDQLHADARFGNAITDLGDVDGDGVLDIAVGAHRDDDGGNKRGAIYILFLNIDGTVKNFQKISDTQGGFEGTLVNLDNFGNALTNLGDLDGDGVVDIATQSYDKPNSRGAVWILFLNADGTVKSHQKISDTEGNFGGTLDDLDVFGWELSAIGDLDKDGVTDLAANAPLDDDGGPDRGAIWILFLNADGTVKSEQKISDTEGNFSFTFPEDSYGFGWSVESIGDFDHDGNTDIAAGAIGDDGQGTDRGVIFFLYLESDGTVNSYQRIGDLEGGFTGDLGDGDAFGQNIAAVGDLNGDGWSDIVTGLPNDDDDKTGNGNVGSVWVLMLRGPDECPADLDGSGAVDFGDILAILSAWGQVGGPGDLDGSGTVDFGDLLVVLSSWGPCK